MKLALASIIFSLSAHAADAVSFKVRCDGLATVGVPVDPGYFMGNRGMVELDVTPTISNYNKCDGSDRCWMTGRASMDFKSVPNGRVLLQIEAVQQKAGEPVEVSSVLAKLVVGNRIVAVSTGSGGSLDVVSPEPYQILMNAGKPDMGVYEGYESGLLKGNIVDEIHINCAAVK